MQEDNFVLMVPFNNEENIASWLIQKMQALLLVDFK